MNKFIDRKCENPNKKILEVENVEYDDAGFLKRIYVTSLRNDGPVTEEGTALNANNLNTILEKMIIDKLSYSQKVSYDKERISLPEYIFETYDLPEKGYLESNFTWNTTPDSCIQIINNQITIKDEYKTMTLAKTEKLFVTITNGTITDTETYDITMLLGETYMDINLNIYPGMAAVHSKELPIDSTAELIVNNPWSEMFYVNIEQNVGGKYTVYIIPNKLSGNSNYSFEIIARNKETNKLTNLYKITVNNYESTYVED